VLAGQQRDDDVVLAVTPDRQDEALVMPLQDSCPSWAAP
jgi:hypothetical protein